MTEIIKEKVSFYSSTPIHGVVGAKKTCLLKTKVYFRWVCENADRKHTVVFVVGSSPELGCWNIEQGVRMHTNADIFPCFVTDVPISLLSNTRIQYKFGTVPIGVNKTPNFKAAKFEAIEGNREIIPTGPYMTIEDDEGLYRARVSKLRSEEEPGKNFTDIDSLQGNA